MEVLKCWEIDDIYFIKIRIEEKNSFYIWKDGYFQRFLYTNFETWEYRMLEEYILKDNMHYKKMEEAILNFIDGKSVLWEDEYDAYDSDYMCEMDWWWK